MTPVRFLEPALERWLSEIPFRTPLTARSDAPIVSELTSLLANSSTIRGTSLEALLWLRIGSIEQAHEIAQSDPSPMGSYLHGVVHRIEGDHWNSKYWFRRVQSPSLLYVIQSSVAKQGSTSLDANSELFSEIATLPCMDQGVFAVEKFVDACAACRTAPNRQALEAIGHWEWLSLWHVLTVTGYE